MRPVGSASQFLRELIAAHGGALPFERFMQTALYDPQHGYYSRRVRTIGRGGDFATSATLGGALGQAVAAWAAAHRAEVANRAGKWHLIELGGGNGELAMQIGRALGWRARRGWQHHIVEVSATLRTEQRRRLANVPNVTWHTDIRDALELASQQTLIFSNEFVDAFPCVQLVRGVTDGKWREVCVSWPEGVAQPVEVLREWEGPVTAASVLDGGSEQRVEAHLAYQRWLSEWLPHWADGRILTIDYGGSPTEIYHRQPRGTLRAYFQHQRFTGPEIYQRFGHQDLTADVNFTDLQAWGAVSGLETTGYETQADFLRRWLPRRAVTHARDDPVLAYLLDPAGAGGAFKVLEQTRPAHQNAA